MSMTARDIVISYNGNQPHVYVDGVDMAPAITGGGLRIEWVEGKEHPVVTMTLMPRNFRAHLPAALLAKVDELLPAVTP